MRKWLLRYKTLLIVAGIIVLLVVLVHLFRTDHILAPYWKQGNDFANEVFLFLDDWAMVLSAAMTLLLAIAAFMTLAAIAEQRRRSITPYLQVDEISPTFDRKAFVQYEPPIRVSNPKKRYFLQPMLDMKVSNLGSGAILALDVSVDLFMQFIDEDSQERNPRKLHFDLPRYGRDQYIEPTQDEPRIFIMEFLDAMLLAPEEKVGYAKCTFNFRDIDGNPIEYSTSYKLSKDMCQIPSDETEVIPGDDEYPDVTS